MAIFNITGSELYVVNHAVKYEASLQHRERTIKTMHELPSTVYAAVALNRILRPEKPVSALGSGLKSVHVFDGNGAHECDYYSRSEKGDNDWRATFHTLYKAGYNRPLMFEFQYKDIGDLKPCYNFYITGYLSKSNHILNSQSASHD